MNGVIMRVGCWPQGWEFRVHGSAITVEGANIGTISVGTGFLF